MMKHLNNKGYMLVEIVLAFVLAMVVMYFITELTIKLKNKNDDLLVKTLVATDQAIIYNTIMKDLYTTEGIVNCDYLSEKGLNVDAGNNMFEYNEFKNIVSEYAVIGNYECTYTDGVISLKIPIEVEQLPGEQFDVNIQYQYNPCSNSTTHPYPTDLGGIIWCCTSESRDVCELE